MKTISVCLFAMVLYLNCQSQTLTGNFTSDLVFQQEDKEIAHRIIARFENDRKLLTGELMIKIAESMLGTPYVAHTLETDVSEKMVVNLREMDCTTFAENLLALARTIKSEKRDFEAFVAEMEKIRYRGGVRNGYLSRLHYFSEWIYDNEMKGIIKDIAGETAGISYPVRLSFMSQHPQSYKVLKDNPGFIDELIKIETKISGIKAWYIPKGEVVKYESQFKDGDILALTTNIDGLDVTHVGLVIWKNGKVRMIHASSKEMKVVITDETLGEYLKGSKITTGIMVARPL